MKKKSNVYDIITEAILQKLEQGVIPWNKPWKGDTGKPKNFKSKHEYSGINYFLTASQGYDSPFWLTYKQAKELGGQVKEGEKGTPIIFFKMIERENKKDSSKTDTFPIARYYRIFNIEQIEGIEKPIEEKEEDRKFNPIVECENLLHHADDRIPELKHEKNKAYYSPVKDYINMPKKEKFLSDEEYYATLFHEVIHSTGHEEKLGRFNNESLAAFGSQTYSKEELIAEMGACFLCGETGIEKQVIDNSASYINSWMKVLRGDSRLVVSAATQARKAVEYLIKE
jgi:antirestriction protein ArdC